MRGVKPREGANPELKQSASDTLSQFGVNVESALLQFVLKVGKSGDEQQQVNLIVSNLTVFNILCILRLSQIRSLFVLH